MFNNTNSYGAISPLNHDTEGRFSRKGAPKGEPLISRNTWESLLISLFVLFLIATDFILFAGSGNIEVFRDKLIPIPEVLINLVWFVVFSFGLIFLFNNKPNIKYGIAGFMAFAFVYVVFKQFAQMNQLINLGGTMITSSVIVGLFVGGITYAFFANDKMLLKVLWTLTIGILFSQIYINYMDHKEPHEFIESYNIQKDKSGESKRFIYLMLPNLASYPYISVIKNDEAQFTQQLMMGFYQKNKFKIFPKAYSYDNNYLSNLIHSFNPNAKNNVSDYILNTRLLSSYWRFFNLKNDFVYLKENELFEIFKKNNFQISAYKSRDFDLCNKNHQYNVDRCIEKVNQPTNIYDMNLSTYSKANILLIEWLSSMQTFNNLSSIYQIFTNVMNMDNTPLVGVNYNNLYVVNSIKTFDILYKNIKQDSGKQAYFVFADIPSDMYIYNEYCNLKPKENWLDMANLPWIRTDYTQERKSAYMQQTRCLYGKMEQFMNSLAKDNLLKDTVIVVQGISSVNDFKNYQSSDFTKNFISNRLVNMAIYDNKMKDISINKNFCSTNNILLEYLFNIKKCQEKDNLGVHEKILNNIKSKLSNLLIDIDKKEVDTFNEWYKKWTLVNGNQIKEDEINIGYPTDVQAQVKTAPKIDIKKEIVEAKKKNVEAEKSPTVADTAGLNADIDSLDDDDDDFGVSLDNNEMSDNSANLKE